MRKVPSSLSPTGTLAWKMRKRPRSYHFTPRPLSLGSTCSFQPNLDTETLSPGSTLPGVGWAGQPGTHRFSTFTHPWSGTPQSTSFQPATPASPALRWNPLLPPFCFQARYQVQPHPDPPTNDLSAAPEATTPSTSLGPTTCHVSCVALSLERQGQWVP